MPGKVRVDGAELAEGATEIMEKFVTEKETYIIENLKPVPTLSGSNLQLGYAKSAAR